MSTTSGQCELLRDNAWLGGEVTKCELLKQQHCKVRQKQQQQQHYCYHYNHQNKRRGSQAARRVAVGGRSAIHIHPSPSLRQRWPTLLVAFTLSVVVALSLCLANLIQPASGNMILNQQQSQQQTGQTVIASTNRKPAYISMHACEDRQLTINCDYGTKINLIRANYGRFSISVCNDEGQSDLSTDCTSPISYRIMHDRCQDKSKCSINATSAIFGDKCPKTRKYLEVHYQCQPDTMRSSSAGHLRPGLEQSANNEPLDRVDVRNASTFPAPGTHVFPSTNPSGSVAVSPVLPPNNPHNAPHMYPQQPSTARPPIEPPATSPFEDMPLPYQARPMMNSNIVNYVTNDTTKSSYNDQAAGSPIVVALRHIATENMSNPRCVLWDQMARQWTERGSQIIESNSTHTICAFDQATQYLLVMDYVGPRQTSSPVNPTLFPPQQPIFQLATQPSAPGFGNPLPEMMEKGPVVLDQAPQAIDTGKGGSSLQQPQLQQQQSSSFVRFIALFGYFLAFVFVAIAFITIAFIASSMRSSAGAAFKSLGNFTAFGGPKYKNRRADGTLHNKDLLVINNQNGHQFIYAPASTTKISTSASTHILTGSNQHQNTLHQIQQQQQQQQQMYSGNGTLSNLSGTGGQSNNYYYGLMGFNSLVQQQQQHHQSQLQHHLSQHHLNQHQVQQQTLPASSFAHQANKSTISAESSNSTPSSSGVESAATSIHQQQQQQQQSCLMMNSEYNLMGHLSNYGHHQNLMSQQQQQPTLTLNAHYSPSGQGPMSLGQQQQPHRLFNTVNQSMRDHIYECVDDDKSYGTRGMLVPTANNASNMNANDQLFTPSKMSLQNSQQQQSNLSRTMTLSSRMIQDAMQQQQQQQQQNHQQQMGSQTSKRLFSHPAIVRDNHTKTNIICSQLAQVTPQRATEVNKFQHDVMAIYNGNDTTTTTTTTAPATNPSSVNSSTCYGRSELGDLGAGGGNKLSTDC